MKIIRGLCSIAAVAGVTTCVWLTGQIMANADPEEGSYHIMCDVYSQGFGPMGPMGMSQYAGTVDGFGSDEGEAMQDAQRKMWGPYGNMPSLQNCHPA